jgi:peptidylprolyl isomerase
LGLTETKPPFPINLIFNIKAFYLFFIVVMIASLAAIGLGPGFSGSPGTNPPPIEDASPEADEITSDLPTFDAPAPTIDTSRKYRAVIETDKGQIQIELFSDAPQAVNSFAFLAGQNYYDGLTFFYVDKRFFAQAGDPTCDGEGSNACEGNGGPGYTLAMEPTAVGHDQWAVVAPAVIEGQEVHGSQFRILFDANERLNGRETVFGRVIAGQEILQGLPDYVPCFGQKPTGDNPCDPDPQATGALTIQDVIVEPV